MKSNEYVVQFLQSPLALRMTVPSFEFDIETVSIGSVKQIEWAKNIQRTKVFDACDFAIRLADKIESTQTATMFSQLFTINDSKFWIDNRALGVLELVAKAIEI